MNKETKKDKIYYLQDFLLKVEQAFYDIEDIVSYWAKEVKYAIETCHDLYIEDIKKDKKE